VRIVYFFAHFGCRLKGRFVQLKSGKKFGQTIILEARVARVEYQLNQSHKFLSVFANG
jgi:hypothetical protein